MEQLLRKFYGHSHHQLQDNQNPFLGQQSLPVKTYLTYPANFHSLQAQANYSWKLNISNKFLSNRKISELKKIIEERPHSKVHLYQYKKMEDIQLEENGVLDNQPQIHDKKQQPGFQELTNRSNSATKHKKRNFKSIVIAILFIITLSKYSKISLMKKKDKTKLVIDDFLNIIIGMVNYYAYLLEQELSNYYDLLKIKLERPQHNVRKDIIRIVKAISQKLAESDVTLDFINAMQLIAYDHSFIPDGFLTQFEIDRLSFDPKWRCTTQVSYKQSRMIVGMCLGVKIFCGSILYRPWLIPDAPTFIKTQFPLLSKIIHSLASLVYFTLTEEFNKLPIIKPSNKAFVVPCPKLNIYLPEYPEEFDTNTKNDMLPNQSDKFYQEISVHYPEDTESFKADLIRWIDRVTLACLKKQKRSKFRISE